MNKQDTIDSLKKYIDLLQNTSTLPEILSALDFFKGVLLTMEDSSIQTRSELYYRYEHLWLFLNRILMTHESKYKGEAFYKLQPEIYDIVRNMMIDVIEFDLSEANNKTSI